MKIKKNVNFKSLQKVHIFIKKINNKRKNIFKKVRSQQNKYKKNKKVKIQSKN